MIKLSAQVGNEEREITVEPAGDGQYRVTIGGVARVVDARRVDGGAWSLLVDGRSLPVDIDVGKGSELVAELRGGSAAVKLLDHRARMLEQARSYLTQGRSAPGPLDVRAPMPGRVVKVLVKGGERVAAGAGLVVVEAMKMENEIRAPREGAVQTVHAREGQAVEAGEPLVTLA